LGSSLRSSPRSASPPRVGAEEPRIWTPPLRPLTEETTHGFSVIKFAKDVIGIDLLPWQKWLLVHALELDDGGLFRFRNVVVLVARQNGKSTLSQVVALWFMFVYGYRLVLGTAQDLSTAEHVWEGAVELVEETPELNELLDRVVKVNGQKSLELTTGQRYKVKAAGRRARGLSGDLIILDELQEHHSWDAWGAITKTTMARDNAQIWALSNAGNASSIVCRYLRKMAHAALGDPDGINAEEDPSLLLESEDQAFEDNDETLGIFEWSAPPGCDAHDRDAWAQANPSLGHRAMITERTIGSVVRTDPEYVFRTEVLCQWSDGSIDGPFPAGTWEAGMDPESRRVGPFVFAVDVSWNRGDAWIAGAGRRADGEVHVQVIERRSGTYWVADWLKEWVDDDDLRGVVLQAKGAPVSSLLEELQDCGIPVIEWGGSDLGAACGSFYDLVTREPPGLFHRPQPALDVAAATAATRPLGDSWVWDRRKSSQHSVDIAPLVAATAALWGLTSMPERRVSAYEHRGMEVVG
jgi:hypothetical protein